MIEYKCKKCEKEFGSYDSLRRHMSRIHKVNSIDFYVRFYLNGKYPKCKCGCQKEVKWSHQLKSFRDYCAGHQSRVHNNWGHNSKSIEKSAETRRRQFANGERKVWNVGLTRETDERVRINGKGRSLSFTKEDKKEYSVRMKRMRLDETVPTLYGPNSSQWKGGISEVNNIARSSKRLYDEWKYPILVRDGFKCIECDNTDKLHIHHDKEKMCEIVKKHMPDMDSITDFELKKLISEKVVDYHIKNKVSGITLCRNCHNKYHPSLNFN